MSLCTVPLRVGRSASSRDASDSPSSSSPSSLVRRQTFKTKKQSSLLRRSITMSSKRPNVMRSIVRHWKKFTQVSQNRYLALEGHKDTCRSCANEEEREEKKGSDFSCFSLRTASNSNCSPKSVKHLARSAVTADVPEGCLTLFVGRERRRFVVGAHYLEHNLFRGLVECSAAEFGFDQKGGITIACEVVLFEHLLWLIGTDDPSSRHLEVDELLDFYAY